MFEVFGTVEKTYYSMRFNKVEDITTKEVKIGDTIMYAPTADNITKYVFLKELQRWVKITYFIPPLLSTNNLTIFRV